MADVAILGIETTARLAGLSLIAVWAWRAIHARGTLRGPRPIAWPTLTTFLVAIGGTLVIMSLAAPADESALGSDAWHRARGIKLWADLATAVLLLALARLDSLAPRRTDGDLHEAGSSASPRAPVALLSAAATFLILQPVCGLLLDGMVLFRSFTSPGATLPAHPLLIAFENSEWGAWGRAQIVLAAVFAAAVTEELLFRGYLLGLLRRALPDAAAPVLISGILFGAVHGTLEFAVPLAAMGVVLGVLRLHYGLWPCIVCHALFNAKTLSLALLHAR